MIDCYLLRMNFFTILVLPDEIVAKYIPDVKFSESKEIVFFPKEILTCFEETIEPKLFVIVIEA